MSKYLEVKTMENLRVFLRKDQVAAIEEIPTTVRSEGHLKLYVVGYTFHLKETAEELVKKLDAE